jgi:NADH-quinone oxidoreductase subunit K
MTMVSLHSYLILSAIIFAIGTVGVLTRRNAIVIFMCVEMMLNAVNLTFIALSKYLGSIDGQIFVLFVMTVAAAEAAVGLALMIAFYKNRESIDVEDLNLMKW